MPQARCARCGQPITATYVTAMGKTWHPEHFTCAKCGKALANEKFVEKEGKPYCTADYLKLFGLKCSVCGQYIDGPYIEDFWKDTFCSKHLKEFPSCFNCERPISPMLTKGGVDFGDGRFCCNVCKPKIIGEAEINRRVLPRLVAFFENYRLPLTSLIQGVPVRVVSSREMTKYSQGDSLHPVTGLIRKLVISEGRPATASQGRPSPDAPGRNPLKKIQEILVLNGLTEIGATAVLAHEVGHAYMFAHDFAELPPVVEEGMAELFAFLWLRSRKGPEVAFYLHRMEENESPIYGEGYKHARQYMFDNGFWKLLDYVKKNARFPQ